MSLQSLKVLCARIKCTSLLFRRGVCWHRHRTAAACCRSRCLHSGFIQGKMLLNVSSGYNNDFFLLVMLIMLVMMSAFSRWLHRKPDPMDYGVMDNPAFDWRAEVSEQKMSNQSSANSVRATFGFSAIHVSFFYHWPHVNSISGSNIWRGQNVIAKPFC